MINNNVTDCSILMKYQGANTGKINVVIAASQLTSQNRTVVDSVTDVSNYNNLCSSFQKLNNMRNSSRENRQFSSYDNNHITEVTPNDATNVNETKSPDVIEQAVISYSKKCIKDTVTNNFQKVDPEQILIKTIDDIVSSIPARKVALANSNTVINAIGNIGTPVSSQIIGSIGTVGTAIGETIITTTAKSAIESAVKSFVATAVTTGGIVGAATTALAPALAVGIALETGHSIIKRITK